MRIQSFGLSHPGLVRKDNEDRFLSNERNGIFLVADGMGGLSRGEMASSLAIETTEAFMKRSRLEDITWPILPEGQHSMEESRFVAAIALANWKIHSEVLKEPSAPLMGTTLTGLLIDGENLIVSNVGDSRIYRIRGDFIEQLTEDHSFVMDEVRRGKLSKEEAKAHRRKHVISRALGLAEKVDIDIFTVTRQSGDTYILCSDGLSDMVSDENILSIVQAQAAMPIQEAVQSLVDAAIHEGGRDNITVVMLRFGD